MLQSSRKIWICRPEVRNPSLEWPESAVPEKKCKCTAQDFHGTSFPCKISFWSSLARCHFKPRNESPKILFVSNYNSRELFAITLQKYIEKHCVKTRRVWRRRFWSLTSFLQAKSTRKVKDLTNTSGFSSASLKIGIKPSQTPTGITSMTFVGCSGTQSSLPTVPV